MERLPSEKLVGRKMKVKGKFTQSSPTLCGPMEFSRSGEEVDFPGLSELIGVHYPPWPREGMIIYTLSLPSAHCGETHPHGL